MRVGTGPLALASFWYAAACGGKAVVDATGGGGQGGAVVPTSTTTTSTASSSSSGSVGCASCAELISEQPPTEPACPGSQLLLSELQICVCDDPPGNCETECQAACSGQGEPTAWCEDCIANACGPQLDACLSDVEP